MIGVVMVSEENNILLPRPALATGISMYSRDEPGSKEASDHRSPIAERTINKYPVSSASTTANSCTPTSCVLHTRGHGYRSNRSSLRPPEQFARFHRETFVHSFPTL